MIPKMTFMKFSPDSWEAYASVGADAWVQFAAAAITRPGVTHQEAAIVADALLLEWKARFVEEHK